MGLESETLDAQSREALEKYGATHKEIEFLLPLAQAEEPLEGPMGLPRLIRADRRCLVETPFSAVVGDVI